MSKYRKYGKWFVAASVASGFFLLAFLAFIGVPFGIAIGLASLAAIPCAMAMVDFWLEPDEPQLARVTHQ